MEQSNGVMVVIPCRNEVKAVAFADIVSCLLHGMAYWSSRYPGSRYQVQAFTRAHIVEVRNEATRIARDDGIDWVLWLDDDMAPPHDLLQRLHETGKTFVGAVAYKRAPPFEPCVGRTVDGRMERFDPEPDAGVVEADMTGFACVLTHRSVLDAVFDATDGLPFQMQRTIAEDQFFCAHARRLGIPLHIVSDVVVGHLGDIVVRREHRLAALARERPC